MTSISLFLHSQIHTQKRAYAVFLVIKGIIIERGRCQKWCSQQPPPIMFCYPVSLEPQAGYPRNESLNASIFLQRSYF